jgi:dTDP-glucose 4,6-dehydratase
LLDAAAEFVARTPQASVLRFIQVSTDEVFGSTPIGKFNEGSPHAPNSPYAASKAAADHLARAWNRTFGLPTIVTWCGNNYGPGQFPEKLIPLTISRALRGEPLAVYGQGLNVRDWIHVSDHCRALEAILESADPATEYAISAGEERRNIDVVTSVCRALDRLAPRGDGAPHDSAVAFVEDRPGHDERYALDAGRLSALGWRPIVGFDQGLVDTVEWYLNHRDWLEAIARTGYKGERLGKRRVRTA